MDKEKNLVSIQKWKGAVKQGCVSSTHLLNLYSNEAILKELESLPGYIIRGKNLKIIR